MSGNNDSNNSTGAAMVLALCAFLAIGFWIVAAIITAILTLIAIVGCFCPIRLGSDVIQPKEARWFLFRGTIGWFAFPAVIIYAAPHLDIRIQQDWIIYMAMTGYMIGSTGVEYFLLKAGAYDQPEIYAPVQAHSAPPAPSLPALPSQSEEPFRYASWDDEEELRR